MDNVVRDLNKANKDDLDVVINLNMAHQQLSMRNNVKDFAAAQKIMPAMIESMKCGIAYDIVDDFVNVLHIAVTMPANSDDEDELGKQYADLFATHKAGLEDLKIRTINILVAAEKKNPKYFSYPQCQNFEEDPLPPQHEAHLPPAASEAKRSEAIKNRGSERLVF